MERLLKSVLKRFGYTLTRKGNEELFYLHDYAGGYDQYRDAQIKANVRKLDNVWADQTTLGVIAEDVRRRHPAGVENGICHGARNGFEVAWLREALAAEVIGTDISQTATQFPHMVVWDFHEPNPDWAGKFDFVYTNSLDQANAPQRALDSWAGQLKPDGRIYIEHSMSHSPAGAGEMDPFGAHPMIMPYLFFTWGRGRYALDDILEVAEKSNNAKRVWIFVLRPVAAGDAGTSDAAQVAG